MNQIQTFKFETAQVRTHIDSDGAPWFVAKDVCDVLSISKYRDAVARLDADEARRVKVDTLGGVQGLIAVNESGLYSLIMASNKSEAKQFKKWVTSEVLPSIRKTGSYSVNRAEWLAARNQGKLVRAMVADVIAKFIEHAKSQGSSNAEKYYINFSKMVNDALIEIDGAKPKNLRDSLNSVQLGAVSVAENIIARSLSECIAKNLPYKDSYQIAKAKIQTYASTVGRTRIGQSERQSLLGIA